MHFALFGLKSAIVFEGTTECEYIYRFNSIRVRLRNMRIRNGQFEDLFCLRYNLSNDIIISS